MTHHSRSRTQDASAFDTLRQTATFVLAVALIAGVFQWMGRHAGMDADQAYRQAEQSVTEYCIAQKAQNCGMRLIDATAPASRTLASAWTFRFRSPKTGLISVEVNDNGHTQIHPMQ